MEKPIYVQLRLTPELSEELKQAAAKAVPSRSLPGEILHRLDAYRPGADDPQIVSRESISCALGDLVTELSDRAARILTTQMKREVLERAEYLGLVADAFVVVMNSIGAAPVQETGFRCLHPGYGYKLGFSVGD